MEKSLAAKAARLAKEIVEIEKTRPPSRSVNNNGFGDGMFILKEPLKFSDEIQDYQKKEYNNRGFVIFNIIIMLCISYKQLCSGYELTYFSNCFHFLRLNYHRYSDDE